MPLPQQTFSTFDQLVTYINNHIIPNADAEITGIVHNNVANGLTTWLYNAALNSALVRIYDSGGVITVDHNISAFTTVLPTTVAFPDNFVKEYYFVNALPDPIPLATGYSYTNLLFETKTEIPAVSVLHLAKASNGSWIQVNNNPVAIARNGLSTSGGYNVLGQDVSQVGNPARLLSNREIPFNLNSIYFSGDGFLQLHNGSGSDPFVFIRPAFIEISEQLDNGRASIMSSGAFTVTASSIIGGTAVMTAGQRTRTDRSSLSLITNFRNLFPNSYSAIFMDDFSINTYIDGFKIGDNTLTSQPITLDVTNKAITIDGVGGTFPSSMKLSSSDGVTDISFMEVIDSNTTFELRVPVLFPTGVAKMNVGSNGFTFSRTAGTTFTMNATTGFLQVFNPDFTKIGFISAGKQALDYPVGPAGVFESGSVSFNFGDPTDTPFDYSIPNGVPGMYFDFVFSGSTTPGSQITFLFAAPDVPSKKGSVGTSGGFIRNSVAAGGEAVRLVCIGLGDGVKANWQLLVLDGSSFANWIVN